MRLTEVLGQKIDRLSNLINRSVLLVTGISCERPCHRNKANWFGNLVGANCLQGGSFSKERRKDHLEVRTPNLVSETLIKLMIYQSMIMHRFLCYKTADNYHQHQYIHS